MASPSPVSGLRAIQYSGCFSSSYPLQNQGSYTFQSSGACQNECVAQGKPVMGLTSGTNCFCGDQLPPVDTKVADTDCNTPCAGYNKEFCGAANRWTVYLTGSTLNSIDNAPDSKSSSSAPPASGTAQSITTAPGQTVVMTVPAGSSTASATPSSAPSSGPNKTGIAVGVVVGVVVLLAIIGGIFLFLRRRQHQLAEKEYQRQNSVSAFMENGRPPGTSHSTGGDSRLDPRVFERRQSDGSIADNEDYSRRILKVTNPDRG
ncbi:hypothetical protein EV356DRAFT_511559 [Viridothelium virens]|uniref:WSC domain-containing protein n=1 Tax=Viridothelium virens TaxID=1048519 RepID=A0A6A6HH28_VIRVR|nr:hypothetical protein EV356DRAFT_511559 [Viridothelium virens]